MRSETPLVLSLCALATLAAAGCAKSTPEANSNVATPSSLTTGAAQSTSAAGQANAPVAPAAPGTVASQNNSAGGAKEIDACALLTSDEIKAVQGEAVKEAKASAHNNAPLNVSQCLFTAATFNKSVSLEVTSGASGGRGAREFWEKQFARAREESGRDNTKSARERERERKREKKQAEPRANGEEEGSLPVEVKGVGDEAFWAASKVNGTLYARKGDAFVRVSIGGTDNEATRLGKVKTLAQKALARL